MSTPHLRAGPSPCFASKRDLDALREATLTRNDPNIRQLVHTVSYLTNLLGAIAEARSVDDQSDFLAAARQFLEAFNGLNGDGCAAAPPARKRTMPVDGTTAVDQGAPAHSERG